MNVIYLDHLATIRGGLAVADQQRPIVIDPTTPSDARIYDYFLGGKDNFPADREAAEHVLEFGRQGGFDVRDMCRANRAFLVRVVHRLAEAGVRQFLDIGAGLPTQQNVHQVAQSIDPEARVVYVDNDPIVLTHARALLADSPLTIAVEGDLREPGKILADPVIRAHLDFDQPVAILVLATLHLIIDDQQAADSMTTLREGLPSGGYLALSHTRISTDGEADETHQLMHRTSQGHFVYRTPEQIAAYLDGMDLLPPGLVPVETWRPCDDQWPGDPSRSGFIGAVARKL